VAVDFQRTVLVLVNTKVCSRDRFNHCQLDLHRDLEMATLDWQTCRDELEAKRNCLNPIGPMLTTQE
jgi:hypothetical protein